MLTLLGPRPDYYLEGKKFFFTIMVSICYSD